MLLTIAWAGSLYLGRCDLRAGPNGTIVAKDKTLGVFNCKYDLKKTGVTTDSATKEGSWAMALSSLLYLVIQIPAFMGDTKDPAIARAAFYLSLAGLAMYIVYQIKSPDLQRKKMERAHNHSLRVSAVGELARLASIQGNTLLNPDFSLNREAANELFRSFDMDGNRTLDASEVKGLIRGLFWNVKGLDYNETDSFMNLFQELDEDGSGTVDLAEFTGCLDKWVSAKMRDLATQLPPRTAFMNAPIEGQEEGASLLTDEEANESQGADENDDDDEEPLTPRQIYTRAALKLLAGTTLIILFADPMVDAVSAFAKATTLPAFFVSFVITPFASNASELVSSLTFAAKKRKKNISLTYSQVYGAVTMNNTMCFSVFMALVAFRGIEWTFSAEVTVTLLAIWALSAVVTQSHTFQLWLVYPVMAMYPTSILLVAYFKYVLGWQ